MQTPYKEAFGSLNNLQCMVAFVQRTSFLISHSNEEDAANLDNKIWCELSYLFTCIANITLHTWGARGTLRHKEKGTITHHQWWSFL